jgi:hypothetical protein
MLGNYPGNDVSAAQFSKLALHYADAAHSFSKLPEKQKGLALAPYRLLAIHAIELALNALLLHNNVPPEKVRGLQHNLQERITLTEKFGLTLRAKTVLHIKNLTDSREYLVHRYDPQTSLKVSQLNRLIATMQEVSCKVQALLAVKQKEPKAGKATEHKE